MKLLVVVLALLAFFEYLEAAPVKCDRAEHDSTGISVESVARRLDIVLEMAKAKTPIGKINSMRYQVVSGFTYTVEYDGSSGDKCQIVWTDIPYDAIQPQEIKNSCHSGYTPVTMVLHSPMSSSQKVDSSPASNKIVDM